MITITIIATIALTLIALSLFVMAIIEDADRNASENNN